MEIRIAGDGVPMRDWNDRILEQQLAAADSPGSDDQVGRNAMESAPGLRRNVGMMEEWNGKTGATVGRGSTKGMDSLGRSDYRLTYDFY